MDSNTKRNRLASTPAMKFQMITVVRPSRFPKVQQITCITIHIHMYGDTGDLLHFWEAARELGSLVID